MATISKVRLFQEIANYIKDENLRGKDRIPTSETIIRKLMTQYSKTSDEIIGYLEQLKDLHFIFIVNVVTPYPELYLQGVNGYIYSDLNILNEVKHFSEQKLISSYEKMNSSKRKTAYQIMKELQPRIKEFNNTEIGKNLNELTMIEEYIKTISTNSFEYTDSWRKEKLLKLFKEEDISDFQEETDASNASTIERQRYADPGNSKWAKAVNQFSVQFLIRIHFRKYEFDIVKKLIITSKITLLEDLIYIRNTLKELEKQLDKDTILKYHIDKIIELRRIAQGRINNLRKIQLTT
jgi:hypothetical protein